MAFVQVLATSGRQHSVNVDHIAYIRWDNTATIVFTGGIPVLTTQEDPDRLSQEIDELYQPDPRTSQTAGYYVAKD